jgi:transposase-like protein
MSARKRQNGDGAWYRDEATLRAAIEQHGSVTAAAQAHGTSRNTVQTWVTRYRIEPVHPNTPGGVGVGVEGRFAEPAELRKLRRDIERRDAELRALRAEVKHLATRENLLEDIRDMIAPAITALELPPPKPLAQRQRRRRKPLTLVWHATDLHWGEIVESRTINDVNAYSPQIAAKRIEHTIDTILRLADNYEAQHGVDEIVIVQNGDGIGGSIHPDSAEYYARAGKQVVDLSMVLAQVIHELASRFKRVRYLGTVGNHPRTTPRMPTGQARVETSWETLVHEMTAALTNRLTNVTFSIAQGYTLDAYIGPSRWAFSHGDATKGGGGQLGVPAYGLKRQHDANREWSLVLAELTEQTAGSVVRHTRVGHFHTYMAWQAGAADIVLCPSPKGVDPFVKDALGKYSPPQMLVEVVHPEHDLIAHHPINLRHITSGTSRYTWGALETDQPAAKLMEGTTA